MPAHGSPNFKYCVPDVDEETLFDLFSPHTGPGDLNWVAEDAAKDFHSNHDGWESSWPLTFVICDMNDKRLGQAVVDRESVPHFRAFDVVLGTS